MNERIFFVILKTQEKKVRLFDPNTDTEINIYYKGKEGIVSLKAKEIP